MHPGVRASRNVIGENSAMKILGTKQLKLNSEQAVLRAFGGGTQKSLGRTAIPCEHRNQRYKVVFNIVDFEQTQLLSKETCLTLQLFKLRYTIKAEQASLPEHIIKRYLEIFNGLGKFSGTASLKVDGNNKHSASTQ